MKEITKWYSDKIGKHPDKFNTVERLIEEVVKTWEMERCKVLGIKNKDCPVCKNLENLKL